MRPSATRILIVETINDEVGVVPARAINGQSGTLPALSSTAHTWNQERKIVKIPAVERGLNNLFGGDDLAFDRVVGVDERRFSRYHHGLTDIAWFELKVQARGLVKLELKLSVLDSPEAGLFYDHPVSSGR